MPNDDNEIPVSLPPRHGARGPAYEAEKKWPMGRPRKNGSPPHMIAPNVPIRTRTAIENAEHVISEARKRQLEPVMIALEYLDYEHNRHCNLVSQVVARLNGSRQAWSRDEGLEVLRMLDHGAKCRDRALKIIDMLMPYMHAKLASITLSSDPDAPLPTPVTVNKTENKLVINNLDDASQIYKKLMDMTVVEEPEPEAAE